MRFKFILGSAALVALVALSGCGGGKGGVMAGRGAPDEFLVSKRAPLTIPPDFALTPPKPGAPRPQEADSSQQALSAMFGGPAKRSETEGDIMLSRADGTWVRATSGNNPGTFTYVAGNWGTGWTVYANG